MVNKKVQKSGKKDGEKESTSKKIKETKSAEKKLAVTNVEEGAIDMILASRLDNIRDDMVKMMDEILKIKDHIISVKEDMINISNSASNRLERLETRVGIPK
jgi:septum formation topological specificity factor MinE